MALSKFSLVRSTGSISIPLPLVWILSALYSCSAKTGKTIMGTALSSASWTPRSPPWPMNPRHLGEAEIHPIQNFRKFILTSRHTPFKNCNLEFLAVASTRKYKHFFWVLQ